MVFDLSDAALENCIYCGACFRYCILGAYDGLDGMELKALVAGVTRIARKGYHAEKEGKVKELLDRCTLQGYCNKVCPAMVKPLVRNEVVKRRIEEEK